MKSVQRITVGVSLANSYTTVFTLGQLLEYFSGSAYCVIFLVTVSLVVATSPTDIAKRCL